MTKFRIFIAIMISTGFLAFLTPGANAQEAEEGLIELHFRNCATIPADDTSWFDHCHDGAWRASASEGTPATFTEVNSGESFESELDGNGDALVSVPVGTYSYQHPPFHWAEAHEIVCSYVDQSGEPGEQIEDSNAILVQAGDHVVCDFFVVWGEGGAGMVPIEPDDPQGIIELRWRACAEKPISDEEWFDTCFDAETEFGQEPQTDRRVTVQNAEDNMPFSTLLDAHGNAQIVVVPGPYDLPRLTGDFVIADYLYCSSVDADGNAVDINIEIDPLVVNDNAHIVCDYYFVAE